ncbi:MAG: alpha-L-fucosidase [Ferruginibacter sp.]
MKKRYFLFLITLCFTVSVQAQWSVLNTDSVPKGTAFKYQPFSKEEWNASNFATPAQMKWFQNARYGMFIHFGLSAYVKKDLSWAICYTRKTPDKGHGAYPDSVWQSWPAHFKLEDFNADEWVKTAIDAGMKYIVVIAKHHDGFHMWDTKYSDFKITNTPFGKDYLKLLADACHKAKMPLGIYYSQRDWYNPDYAPVDTAKSGKNSPTGKIVPGESHKKYIAYQYNVLRELCTNYGKVDIMWFDAAWWNKMFTADMWDSENLTRMIRKLQPGIIINNRASIPGDFDTPEQVIGNYQERPWESCLTLNGSWAYSDKPNKTKKQLVHEILSAAQGNGNVLLSWGAYWNGVFDSTQKKLLLDIGQWVKKYGFAYYGTKGGPWMPGKWGGATYKGNKVYLYVYDWENSKKILPAIEGNKILQAKYVNSSDKKQVVTIVNKEWIFNAPSNPDSIATIIEVTLQKPVTKAISSKNKSTFDGLEYGSLLKQNKNVKAKEWNNGTYIIDLSKEYSVTGIAINNLNKQLEVSISIDGKKWEAVGKATQSKNEIIITEFNAGVNVLGKKARYIQLKSAEVIDGMEFAVYGK